MGGWRGLDGPPASYLAGGEWPHGRVEGPAEVEVVRRLVEALVAAMGDDGLRATARAAGVNHASLRSVLRGESWPDVVTLARLERALDVDLWPGRVE